MACDYCGAPTCFELECACACHVVAASARAQRAREAATGRLRSDVLRALSCGPNQMCDSEAS
jgi:hypothetical protein